MCIRDRLATYTSIDNIRKFKAANRSSKPPAGLREPGKLRAGVSAETEWTWEPPTESPDGVGAVGLDGEGTVTTAQGISRARDRRSRRPPEMPPVRRRRIRVAPRNIPVPSVDGFFLFSVGAGPRACPSAGQPQGVALTRSIAVRRSSREKQCDHRHPSAKAPSPNAPTNGASSAVSNPRAMYSSATT